VLKVKGAHTRTLRTLFGTFTLPSPRFYRCRCRRHTTTTFRPLTALLPTSVAPELLFIEAKWASLVSYGLTVDALTDFLPLDATLDVKTVRHDTLTVAQRCEDELGEEQRGFVDGGQHAGDGFPVSDDPIIVGIDGGYVRNWEAKKRHFKVIVGKSMPPGTREKEEEGSSSKRFGFVQTFDTKPRRRLCAVLQSQGFQRPQPLMFLSDGADTVRHLQLDLSPEAEHILDWFHVTMKLTVLDQYAKGLSHHDQELGETIRQQLERLKWALWHGNLAKALSKIDTVASLIAHCEETYPKYTALAKAVQEFRTYIENNGTFIPNYGECYRCGEAIATGFVESTVNQVVSKRFCKKQQMQWSKRGAHLLLQTRVQDPQRRIGLRVQTMVPRSPA
jgi:hypothetical protein